MTDKDLAYLLEHVMKNTDARFLFQPVKAIWMNDVENYPVAIDAGIDVKHCAIHREVGIMSNGKQIILQLRVICWSSIDLRLW